MLSRGSHLETHLYAEGSAILITKNGKPSARDYVRRRLRLSDFESRADLLVDAQVKYGGDYPSKTTFYRWVKEWQESHAKDNSGPWTLATDETGRADLVMRVVAALAGYRGSFDPPGVTHREARWIVSLWEAVPEVNETGLGGDRTPYWGTLNLWHWVQDYTRAESLSDTEELARLDTRLAAVYAASGQHWHEANRRPGQSRADLYEKVPSLWPPGLEGGSLTVRVSRREDD